MIRVVYVCSVSELCVHTSIPVEPAYMKSGLMTVERFSEELSFIVISDDIGATRNVFERLYAERFAGSRQNFLSLCCLRTSSVVMLIVCAPTNKEAGECFIESQTGF